MENGLFDYEDLPGSSFGAWKHDINGFLSVRVAVEIVFWTPYAMADCARCARRDAAKWFAEVGRINDAHRT